MDLDLGVEEEGPAPLPDAGVKCPNPDCAEVFTCDVCLHVHLVNRYATRYADVYGPVHDAYVELCDEHAACSTGMLT